MTDGTDLSREELEQQLEEAKRRVREALARMTPQERAAAEARANELAAADAAAMRELVEGARAACAGESAPGPKFCKNCGAPAGGGKFCAFCGSPLA